LKGVFLTAVILQLFINSFSQSGDNNTKPFQKKTFIYKSIDGVPIRADLFQTDHTGLNPVIIYIHGGALIFGSRTGMPGEQVNFYLKNGYSVVSIDYRLAPETKLPEVVNDVMDAIQWVQVNGRDSLGIDSSKIFVVGHSAGAYLSLMTGYILKTPPRAIVSFYGYGDIKSEWYNKPDSFYRTKGLISKDTATKLIYDSVITEASANDRFNLYLYTRQTGTWPMMVSNHNPQLEAKWFDKYCPIENITANYPPVLLIHGDKDTDVPFKQSVLLDNKLKAMGVTHQFIKMKNYDHVFDLFAGGLSNPDIQKAFDDVIIFLDKYK